MSTLGRRTEGASTMSAALWLLVAAAVLAAVIVVVIFEEDHGRWAKKAHGRR